MQNGIPKNLDTLCLESELDKDQIHDLVKPFPSVFSFIENSLVYHAPFDIVDKASLHRAISNTFPTGIVMKELQLCYEFALSDVNELKYENKIVFHKYGKTEEQILFAHFPMKYSIAKLWQNALSEYDKPVNVFKRKRDIKDTGEFTKKKKRDMSL